MVFADNLGQARHLAVAAGWPYCYYDGQENKYFLAPEYGGDGRKTDQR